MLLHCCIQWRGLLGQAPLHVLLALLLGSAWCHCRTAMTAAVCVEIHCGGDRWYVGCGVWRCLLKIVSVLLETIVWLLSNCTHFAAPYVHATIIVWSLSWSLATTAWTTASRLCIFQYVYFLSKILFILTLYSCLAEIWESWNFNSSFLFFFFLRLLTGIFYCRLFK